MIQRHSFEAFAQTQQFRATTGKQLREGKSVVNLDILRPHKTVFRTLDAYVPEVEPFIPQYLRPRFESLVSTFRGSMGANREVGDVCAEPASLVTHTFRLGNENVNLLLLLRKVRSYTARRSISEEEY